MSIFQFVIASMIGTIFSCNQAKFSSEKKSHDKSGTSPQQLPPPISQIPPKATPETKSTHPQNAKKQGHFTAWLEDNSPGYFVVVEIALPPGSNGYQLSDLSGTISGTDGWRQNLTSLKPDAGDTFSVADDKAILRMFVPDGSPMISDTIDINSALLHDHQVIQITFH